ncbi:ABC transporter ATP-binding protein [Aedoeadaptatus acetigenes]|uniref:ABC transporter ATP-binding protein n=2 Tax=Aedoeadaptatus acetigenes TaxID=2981723 RepID=A0ABV1JAQ7_9FIRM|nr:ABC transporter ATP-binding protein [Aedoeadaptatus acetigenes]MCU6787300.1 ABC transporter ATP-binding protein [Aedoeadaptatus acetigenes]
MGEEKVYALRGVNLDIQKEEILCLLGTSGSGKSTLLNMMAGLDRPTKGEIIINNKIHMEKLSEEKLTKFRQLNVGFVFQSYNLIPTLTATENVSLGLIFKGVKKQEREEKARAILERVGLGNRLDHKPSEMSGGQQQRVSIARAFVDAPPILFADEPTGNLDTNTSVEIMEMMCDLAKEHKQTLIIVTHDLETAVYANRIVELRDGKIVRDETQQIIEKARELELLPQNNNEESI